MNFIKDFFNEMISMFKPYYKYIRFFLVLLLFFTSSMFQIIPIKIFNLDINNISNDIKPWLTLFSKSITLIILVLLYYKDFKRHLINLRKMKKEKLIVKFDHAFRYWLIGLIIMLVSNILIKNLGIGNAQNDVSVTNNLMFSPIIFGLITFILAPILEEITFRLAFKDIFKNKWIYILLSGLVFGSIHVIFSLTDITQLLYLIPYCSLGIAFSYIYYDSDNIYIPISFHILHNSLTAIVTFLLMGALIW